MGNGAEKDLDVERLKFAINASIFYIFGFARIALKVNMVLFNP